MAMASKWEPKLSVVKKRRGAWVRVYQGKWQQARNLSQYLRRLSTAKGLEFSQSGTELWARKQRKKGNK